MKVDVLALGMLTCIRKAFDLIHAMHGGREAIRYWPPCREDPAEFTTCCARPTPSACSRWKAARR